MLRLFVSLLAALAMITYANAGTSCRTHCTDIGNHRYCHTECD
jgi:hypothetical protein